MSRVVLTQPEPRVEALARFVRDHGHEVRVLPAGRIEPLPSSAWSDWISGRAPLAPDWVVFVSPGAIASAQALDWPAQWPAQTGLAVIGPGTRQALSACPGLGRAVRIVQPSQPPFDAQSLLREPPFDDPGGLRILVVQGEGVRSPWVEALAARGAHVQRAEVYRHELPATDDLGLPQEAAADLRVWAESGEAVAFVMTSTAGVRVTTGRLRAAGLTLWALSQPALVQHPRILSACREAGWTRARCIDPGRDALLAALESV